jgi:hypothetical protein
VGWRNVTNPWAFGLVRGDESYWRPIALGSGAAVVEAPAPPADLIFDLRFGRHGVSRHAPEAGEGNVELLAAALKVANEATPRSSSSSR